MLSYAFYAVLVQILEVLEVICILEIQGQQLDIPVLNRKTDIRVYASLGSCWDFLFLFSRNFRTFM